MWDENIPCLALYVYSNVSKVVQPSLIIIILISGKNLNSKKYCKFNNIVSIKIINVNVKNIY